MVTPYTTQLTTREVMDLEGDDRLNDLKKEYQVSGFDDPLLQL